MTRGDAALGATAGAAAGEPLILVGTTSGRLWAVTTAGKVRWFSSGPGPITGSALPLDGAILVPSGRDLLALDHHGHEAWRRRSEATIMAGPVALQRRGLVGNGAGELVALDARRADPAWERDLGAGIKQILPLPDEAAALVLLTDGRVLELSARGDPVLGVTPPTPPKEIVHVGSGVVYLVGSDDALLRLDRATGRTYQVLDLASRAMHVGSAGPRGVITITSDGQATIVKAGRGDADNKTE